jgi:hypothetical protein
MWLQVLFGLEKFHPAGSWSGWMTTSDGEDQSVRGPVVGRSWLWWVIDNVVWINSWLSIAGAGCGLICIGAGEERARKFYALRSLRGVERQVGLTWGTWWPVGSSAAAWWQEKEDGVVDRSRCRVAAHDRSLHAGFAAVDHKTVGLLGWATKPRSEARRAETGSGRVEKLRSGGHASTSQGLRQG